MRKFNSKTVFYPYLFLLYPILFLYAHNIREVPLVQIVPSLLAALLLTLIFRFIIGRLVTDIHKRGLLLMLFLILFFYYMDMVDLFNSLIALFDLARASHFVTVYFLLSLWAIFAFFVSKSRKNYLKITKILNISVIFLILFNVSQIGIFFLKEAGTPKRLNETYRTTGGSIKSVPDSRSHPDVYYLVFDELASLSTIKRQFNYDNSQFAIELAKRGFYIAEKSLTRFRVTEKSLATSLNMEYFPTGQNPYKLIRQNKVAHLFKKQGYQVINFTHWIKGTFELSDRTFYYSTGKFSYLFSDFNKLLWQKSLFRFIYNEFLEKIDYHQFHRQRILYLLAQLEKIPADQGPKFIFAHVVSPHDPYVFNTEGHPVERKNHFNLKDKQYFLDQYIYICSRIVRLVDCIMQQSRKPPIIIIQGDHGFRGAAGGRQQVAVGDEWRHIFNAYHLPGVPIDKLHPSISPVNSFRLIFNYYFGYKMALLPD